MPISRVAAELQRLTQILDAAVPAARRGRQVRRLLPASAGTLVLVTSRSQLTGLAAADGARLLSLDVLAHGEATELLAARIGPGRAAAEPGAVSEIANLSACLPLAVTIAAARAAARPGLPLAALADELRNASGRLDVLDAGDPVASVRAVFSWSVRHLSREAARMFRLLGIHPGPRHRRRTGAQCRHRTGARPLPANRCPGRPSAEPIA